MRKYLGIAVAIFVVAGVELVLVTRKPRVLPPRATELTTGDKGEVVSPKVSEPVYEYEGEVAYEKVGVAGKMVREKIPEELALGEYWYWLYFDEPFYLEQNASGQPQYVDKLQVVSLTNEDLDKYHNKHVRLQGRLSWGYAESRIIQAKDIEEID